MTAGPVGRPGDEGPGMLDALVLPGGLGVGPSGPGRRRGGVARGVGAVLFWGTIQGVFLLVPPLAGLAVNVGVAAAFVWWFVLRPSARADARRRANFRLRGIAPAARAWLPVAAAALVALVLAALVVLPRFLRMPVNRSDLLERYLARPGGVLAVLVMVAVVAPLLEEFLFRGWMQRTLERRLARTPGAPTTTADAPTAGTPWRAIGITALVFAAVHLEAYGFPLRLAFGVASGYAAWATRSIWPSVVLHGAYNGSLVLVGSALPRVDERTLTAWAHTDAIFWPTIGALAASGAALAWALRAMRAGTRAAAPR